MCVYRGSRRYARARVAMCRLLAEARLENVPCFSRKNWLIIQGFIIMTVFFFKVDIGVVFVTREGIQ